MKSQYKVYRQTEKPQSSISKQFFDVPFFSEIFQPPGQNQQIGKQCFSPPLALSFKISLGNTSFHISLNSLGLKLSPECLSNFLTFIFHHVWENFSQIWCSHSQKIIESMHFYSCLSPPLKTPGRIFWKSVSPKTKGLEETRIYFIKIQSEIMTMTWNINLFIFCKIFNFFKCYGFPVLLIISTK